MQRLVATFLFCFLCSCSTYRTTRDSCAPPTGDEVVRDLGYQDVNKAHILGFLAEIDNRPLYVEGALVACELKDGKWRLTHVFRRPRERLEHFRTWSQVFAFDVDCVGSRNYEHQPTRAEVEQFLLDSWWHSQADDGFQLIRSDSFFENWKSTLGFVPDIPRKKP